MGHCCKLEVGKLEYINWVIQFEIARKDKPLQTENDENETHKQNIMEIVQ